MAKYKQRIDIRELKRQKKAIIKAIRIARLRNNAVQLRVSIFKRSIHKFPKKDIALYKEAINKLEKEVELKVAKLRGA